MRHLRARTPVRGLALVVLAVLVAGFLAAFTYARRAVADQEGRLLKQRAGEAGVLLNGAVTRWQGATDALAAVVVATHGDTAAFLDAAGRDSAVAGGTSGVALVARNLDGSRVVAARGAGLAAGDRLGGEAGALVDRARASDGFVYSPVFLTPGGERRLGSAMRTGTGADDPVIYREAILRPPGRSRLTATQPFSEIETVLYAGPRADPAQVVLATPAPPPARPTVAAM